MASTWSEEETSKLIDLWGDDVIQAQLEGCKRNREVFEKISRGMAEATYQRSAVQCREKEKKLRAEYKRIKDSNSLSGRDRKTSKIYEKLDEILGHRPATKPEVVFDSSSSSVTSEENSVVLLDTTTELETVDQEPNILESTSSTNEVNKKQEKQVSSVTIEVKSEGRKKRKRPAARDEAIEKVMDSVINKVSKLQEESDARFYELEEKRMKMEERILKMEEERYKVEREREERQRKEERDFQLKIIQMLSGQSTLPAQPHFSLCHESGRNMYEFPGREDI